MKQTAARLSFLSLLFLMCVNAQLFANGHGKILGKAKLVSGTNGKAMNKPELTVSARGGVQNVVITIEGLEGEFREDPIEIDQKNKTYIPRISVSMVGNELTFRNNDAILHNVHTYSGVQTLYNFAMPKFLKKKTVKLEKAGLKKIRCDVHQEMVAYVMVAGNPFYAVTNEGGLFQIDSLPAGTYRIKAWHEKLGTLEQEVTVAAGEKTAVIFEFSK
ncbi:MAG: carboxypeptidase regulatory-like domain-containing protein [bacterium]